MQSNSQHTSLSSSLLSEEVPVDDGHNTGSVSLVLLESLTGRGKERTRSQLPADDHDVGDEFMLNRAARKRVVKVFMENVGHCLALTTFIAFVVGIPALFFNMAQERKLGKDYAAFYSAGLFVMLTLPISIREITKHLTHWYMPDVQKYVVRILWMVPLYSVNSWLSLRFHNASLYIDSIRDFYEAFVLCSFFYFLVELLGGYESLSAILMRKEASLGEHPSCMKWFCNTWDMGEEFLMKCKHGVLQYVVLKTLATIIISFTESIGVYGEGKMDWTHAYGYVSFVTNFSQMWALYCLVKFYYATAPELKSPVDWHPIGKFLCIKGVIFFTWWQGILIVMLKNAGIIDSMGSWDANDVATGLQDYLVCIEMLGFAIAHSFTFTYKEYVTTYNRLDLEHHEGDESAMGTAYSPPSGARQLENPMSLRRALWSSAVPTETMNDIHRMRRTAFTSNSRHDRCGSISNSTELSSKNNNVTADQE
mmetsp:Transcript_13522/g.20591  ORF Transcript_13522/g.20591 Transcript_13522/m.20591 type:complete len:479 (-) Transcript_13522:192-1628(-)|eukprot:CAMPEP_0196817978 /NCGR_PEP_ID=MMETSP1362-20130617/63503_1 /TAXON_ID=163516 /ORGANISM="Leptocylindrus danicus, Strain CCMP1856" /LENGTH=478 /DNA_ID=CAMNT_0042195879 /DNA_START=247 /DNA_END=1683 /DNA_ORIENTATION=+